MERIVRVILIVLFGSFLAINAIADRILAIVGDEVITESELDKVTRLWRYELESHLSDAELLKKWKLIKKEALERLIEDRLLYLEAASEEINVPPERVEQELKRIKQRFHSEEEFLESLRRNHLTPQELYNQIEKQLMVKVLINKKVRSKIYINPTEVAKVFQKHRDEFCVVKRVKIDSLFVSRSKFQNLSEMEFDSMVMDKYMKLSSGRLTWRDLEMEFEPGQISGWKRPEDLAPNIAKSLFSDNEWAYPLPVKVSTGYYLFRVEKKEKDCPKDLTEARERVYNYLFQREFAAKLNEYINMLKEKFYVKINGEV